MAIAQASKKEKATEQKVPPQEVPPAAKAKQERVAVPNTGFAIETGIPAPAGRSKYPFGDMRAPWYDDEGNLMKQSFFVPFPEDADVDRKNAIQANVASSKRGYEQRKEKEGENVRFRVARFTQPDGQEGVRCWREQ